MHFRIYQVDAFTGNVFGGNPAAVVPMQGWIDNTRLQSIAAENNLPETAFFVPRGGDFHLRWFTPTQEVTLCGHATLASAYVVLNVLDPSRRSVKFDTLSGTLEVGKDDGNFLTMDFPRHLPVRCEAPAVLLKGLNLKPLEVAATEAEANYYALYESEQEVRSIRPDLPWLEQLHPYGVVVTARGNRADFVSRYFAPSYGIPEDPVTGSTHCALTPFWSMRTGKRKLHALQVSKRGGELLCEDLGDRVLISGRAVKYLEGDIYI